MTEKEAISILAEVIPKGSDDFERLWKLYGDFCYKGDKRIAIDVFENKWKNFNMEALEKVINMYIKHIKETGAYKYSFASFLDYELENFIQDRQRESEEQEKVNIQIVAENVNYEHQSVIRLINTYKKQFEEFRPLDLKSIGKNGTADYRTWYELDENQVTFLFTLMKNTKVTVRFKLNLTKAFSLMKDKLNQKP